MPLAPLKVTTPASDVACSGNLVSSSQSSRCCGSNSACSRNVCASARSVEHNYVAVESTIYVDRSACGNIENISSGGGVECQTANIVAQMFVPDALRVVAARLRRLVVLLVSTDAACSQGYNVTSDGSANPNRSCRDVACCRIDTRRLRFQRYHSCLSMPAAGLIEMPPVSKVTPCRRTPSAWRSSCRRAT